LSTQRIMTTCQNNITILKMIYGDEKRVSRWKL